MKGAMVGRGRMVALVPEGIAAMHVTSGYYKTTLATFPTKPVRIEKCHGSGRPAQQW
jgi:hypothetical protein